MIENLQHALGKQAKDAKLRAIIRSWRAKNAPERLNMKNQAIF